MSTNSPLLPPEETVLPTMNQDGSRIWIHPRLSKGRFYKRRLLVGWFLIALFVTIPHLYINGKPLFLLNVPAREFTIFGATFLATDVFFLLLFLLGTFLSIFLFTALFGRVWCGWACPQTVYMELLFRPLERLLEGPPREQRRLDKQGPNGRRILKYFVFLVFSSILAHTFLAYFVPFPQLIKWMTHSPAAHPTGFAVVTLVTLAMFADFAYFREQTCLVACPYGRFQSALLDKQSLIVAYDPRRGEPRAMARARKKGPPENAESWGDCIDCGACVATCPTGIDIREGLQMECINCTQCIDACDAIMERIKKPKGLIRYTSQAELEGTSKSLLRGRTIAYPLLIVLVFGLLGYRLSHREAAEITLLRQGTELYRQLDNHQISNQARLKIINRTDSTQQYTLKLHAPKGVKLLSPENPMEVASHETKAITIFFLAPEALFDKSNDIPISLTIKTQGQTFQVPFRFVGPSPKRDAP